MLTLLMLGRGAGFSDKMLEGWKSQGLEQKSKKMIQINIKLII